MSEKVKSSIWEKLTPVLVLLSIGLAFFVGMLWQKVQNLEKGTTVTKTETAQEAVPLSVENIKRMAKDLELNEKQFNKCLDDGQKAEEVSKDVAYGQTVGVSGTPAFFINGRFLGGAFPFASFKEIIDRELDGKGSNDYKTYSKDLQTAYDQGSFIAVAKNIDIGESRVLGDSGAKVTLVEFSDLECPYCIRHFNQTWPELKKTYVDTGKVKVVFKNFPLTFHPNAQKAAEAVECAEEQGKFWEMHDRLFIVSSTSQ